MAIRQGTRQRTHQEPRTLLGDGDPGHGKGLVGQSVHQPGLGHHLDPHPRERKGLSCEEETVVAAPERTENPGHLARGPNSGAQFHGAEAMGRGARGTRESRLAPLAGEPTDQSSPSGTSTNDDGMGHASMMRQGRVPREPLWGRRS